MDVMKSIAQDYIKSDIPAFGVGDTVKVHIKPKALLLTLRGI